MVVPGFVICFSLGACANFLIAGMCASASEGRRFERYLGLAWRVHKFPLTQAENHAAAAIAPVTNSALFRIG